MEEFEDLKDFEGYKINRFGVIKNKFGKIFAQHKCRENCGYFRVSLTKNGISKKYRIHRLLAIQYIPNPDNLLEVDHIDRNTMNNNLDNLRWCDRYLNAGNKNVKGSINPYIYKGHTYYKGSYYIELHKEIQKTSKDRDVVEKWLEETKIKYPR
jgi:hypothetical protein